MKEIQNLDFWDSISSISKEFELNMESLDRRRSGSYYTSLELTDVMMQELVSNLEKENKDITKLRFFEPCVGTGNFVFSYIKSACNTGLNKEQIYNLLNNIYVSDINKEALNLYKELLMKIVSNNWGIELSDDYFKSHVGSGLLVDVMSDNIEYIDLNDIFPSEIVKNGFDIVVTNPPYKNLKAEKSQYNSLAAYEIDRKKYETISSIVANRFKYTNNGVLNLYKLFVEEIIENYSNENALISLLIPASILSDKTCRKIRTHILNDLKINSIKIIEENNNFIDAQQSLVAICMQKGLKTNSFQMTKNYCRNPNDTAEVSIDSIINESTGNSILAVTEEEYDILKKLRRFPTIRELDFIHNLRGELDLTVFKQYITNKNTGYPLLRGKNIGFYKLIESGDEFINTEFLEKTKKKCYIGKERIACQQIANIKKEKRINYSFIPANNILGNSCNFIAVSNNQFGIDIYTLLGLLNTKIINWLFKLTSSNNHVNNYEIDAFPIPVNSDELSKISELTRLFLKTENIKLIDDIEYLAAKAYGLIQKNDTNKIVEEYREALKCFNIKINKDEAVGILKDISDIQLCSCSLNKFEENVIKGITHKYKSLYKNYLLNHITFKLSDLDLEMISTVPQGGNWKNIPMKTVIKSKRLKKISETGGRTTLYGRIDYQKPSYTITTYFNRPGNGTYVHPIHERVLSVREAARFQTFKDDYYFFGNKTQLLKQVGNAVPTLLAYQIAKRIKDITHCSKSIDLFCGAGGMTVGFKAAGIHSLLSNDIEESACTTLKINNPEIRVLCGDITDENVKKEIIQVASIEKADIICGGPPCQGFSLAGFRSDKDPRNQLFRDFVDIVNKVHPKLIVFENVEGLLSYQGGKTYKEILMLFSKMGYKAKAKTLLASEFGIPQRRKRVIIICTRNDLGINPEILFPQPITVKEENMVTAYETISDLENVDCTEKAKYVEADESLILKFFKGKISYEEYVDLLNSKVKVLNDNIIKLDEFGQYKLNI